MFIHRCICQLFTTRFLGGEPFNPRLRAEHGALAATPVVMENPLAEAERWVLYTDVPAVEQTPSWGSQSLGCF